MKKFFEEPVVSIHGFDLLDVIATSNCVGHVETGDDELEPDFG